MEERVKQVFCEVGVDGYYDQYKAEAYARFYAQIDAISEVKSPCGEAVHHFRCCFHGKTKRNSTMPLGEQAAKWAVAAWKAVRSGWHHNAAEDWKRIRWFTCGQGASVLSRGNSAPVVKASRLGPMLLRLLNAPRVLVF